MFEEYPDILTPEEVSEILRIGMNRVYGHLNTGVINAYKEGRIWRIPKKEILNYLHCSLSI